MSHGIQIGKAAEQTGLSIDTIRFYQKIGLVRPPARSEGGFRLFSENEIRDLVFIQQAHFADRNQAIVCPESAAGPRVFPGARLAYQQA